MAAPAGCGGVYVLAGGVVMTDLDALKRLAEAAAGSHRWYGFDELLHSPFIGGDDAHYIAAASPDVVLGLIAELREWQFWFSRFRFSATPATIQCWMMTLAWCGLVMDVGCRSYRSGLVDGEHIDSIDDHNAHLEVRAQIRDSHLHAGNKP